MKRSLALLPAALLAGCLGRTTVVDQPDVATVDAYAADGACTVPWANHAVVIARFGFVRPDMNNNGTVEGFDLDGSDNTDSVDRRSCSQPDATSADGTRGIDNQLAQLLPVVDQMTGGTLDGAIQAAINNGQLLLTVSTDAMPNTCSDQQVTITFQRAIAMPFVGSDMLVNPGQTYDVDRTLPSTTVRARVRDGVLREVEPFTLPMPVAVLDARFTLNLYNTRFRFRLRPDGGYDGMVGGGVSRDELMASVSGLNIRQNLMDAISGALSTFADLAPDARGRCQQISCAMALDGRLAFLNP